MLFMIYGIIRKNTVPLGIFNNTSHCFFSFIIIVDSRPVWQGTALDGPFKLLYAHGSSFKLLFAPNSPFLTFLCTQQHFLIIWRNQWLLLPFLTCSISIHFFFWLWGGKNHEIFSLNVQFVWMCATH